MGRISSRSLVATEEGVEFSLRPVLSVDHGSLYFRRACAGDATSFVAALTSAIVLELCPVKNMGLVRM